MPEYDAIPLIHSLLSLERVVVEYKVWEVSFLWKMFSTFMSVYLVFAMSFTVSIFFPKASEKRDELLRGRPLACVKWRGWKDEPFTTMSV